MKKEKNNEWYKNMKSKEIKYKNEKKNKATCYLRI